MQTTLTDRTGVDTEIGSLPEEMDVVTELTKRCIAEDSQTAQNQEEYAARYNGFVERYEKAKARREQLRATKVAREAQAEAIGALMFEAQELDAITEFDEKLLLTIIDTVTLYTNGRMTFKSQGDTGVAACQKASQSFVPAGGCIPSVEKLRRSFSIVLTQELMYSPNEHKDRRFKPPAVFSVFSDPYTGSYSLGETW